MTRVLKGKIMKKPLILFLLAIIVVLACGCDGSVTAPSNAIALSPDQIASFAGTYNDRYIGETSFTLSKDGILTRTFVDYAMKQQTGPVQWWITTDNMIQIENNTYQYSFDGTVLRMTRLTNKADGHNDYYELVRANVNNPQLHVVINSKSKIKTTESLLAASILQKKNELQFKSKYKDALIEIYSTIEEIHGLTRYNGFDMTSYVILTGGWLIDTSGYENVVSQLSVGDKVKATGYVFNPGSFSPIRLYKEKNRPTSIAPWDGR